MDDSKMFPNFDIFRDFMTEDDITNISDDISDEEIISCMETIEKEQDPPKCRPQTSKKPENARFALLTDEDLTTIITSAEAKGTKKNTKWIVSTIEGKNIFKKSGSKFPYVSVLELKLCSCLHHS